MHPTTLSLPPSMTPEVSTASLFALCTVHAEDWGSCVCSAGERRGWENEMGGPHLTLCSLP